MSKFTLDVPRPVYSADHTGRPTHTGERLMCPLLYEGTRIGYVFAPVPDFLITLLDTQRYTLNETHIEALRERHAEHLRRDAQREEHDGGDTRDAGRGAGDDLSGPLQTPREDAATSADGRAPVADGAGPPTRGETAEEPSEGDGERQPARAAEPVPSVTSMRVWFRCGTCGWTGTVGGAAHNGWSEAADRAAAARHARESVGCDTPVIALGGAAGLTAEG